MAAGRNNGGGGRQWLTAILEIAEAAATAKEVAQKAGAESIQTKAKMTAINLLSSQPRI